MYSSHNNNPLHPMSSLKQRMPLTYITQTLPTFFSYQSSNFWHEWHSTQVVAVTQVVYVVMHAWLFIYIWRCGLQIRSVAKCQSRMFLFVCTVCSALTYLVYNVNQLAPQPIMTSTNTFTKTTKQPEALLETCISRKHFHPSCDVWLTVPLSLI